MAVPVPKSGEVVTTVQVQDMHTVVSDLLNDVRSDRIRRNNLNEHQLPSLVLLRDTQQVGGAHVHLTTVPATFAEDASLIESDWQHLTDYDLKNGAMGWDVGPGIYLAWISIRVPGWQNGTVGAPQPEWNYWLNLGFRIDGVFQAEWINSALGTHQKSTNEILGTSYIFEETEETITIFAMYDNSAGGDVHIDGVELWGALVNCGAATSIADPGYPAYLRLNHAVVSILCLPPVKDRT